MIKLSLCALAFSAQIAHAGLEKYSSLVVADKYPFAEPEPNGIRVTYLGVNGFQFEVNGHALLVDPYFTRIAFLPAALNQPIRSDPNRVAEGLKHVRPGVDAILVTHAHFDHLLDTPEIMQHTHAQLVSGSTAAHLIESFGISRDECEIVKAGDVREIGPWRIRVFAAQHDRLFGKVPFAKCNRGGRRAPGEIERVSWPIKVSDWCVGEPLAFVIEVAGKRIYIDSGGIPGALADPRARDVDLAILGVALPDSRQRFAEAVKELRPRYILPSHQDDMFAPVSRGFRFGKMTNFPALTRESKRKDLPGRLILLDYFRPWTLR